MEDPISFFFSAEVAEVSRGVEELLHTLERLVLVITHARMGGGGRFGPAACAGISTAERPHVKSSQYGK